MNEISKDENTFKSKTLLFDELIEDEIDNNLNEIIFENIKIVDDNYSENYSDNENNKENDRTNQYDYSFTNILNIQKV